MATNDIEQDVSQAKRDSLLEQTGADNVHASHNRKQGGVDVELHFEDVEDLDEVFDWLLLVAPQGDT